MTTMMAPPGSGQKGKHKDKGNETKAKQSGEKEYRLREQNQAKQMQQKRPRLDLSPNSRPKREPRKPATTLTQVMRRKHLVPAAPPTGYERRFQRLTTNGVGQGGVGVLKWEEHGKTVTQTIEVNEQVTLGRDPACKIQVSGRYVSELHLRFHAVYTSSPLALVCMEALSINGYILNGKRFRPAQKLKFAGQAVCPKLVVLRDGDTIEIPHTSLSMTYKHNSAKYPIVHAPNTLFDDYFLFHSSSLKEEHDTKFWRIVNYPLGSGTFGVVNLAIYKNNGLQVACKTIDSRGTAGGGSWQERVQQEVGNMKQLNHPNILRTLDSIKDHVPTGDVVEDEYGTPVPSGVWKAHIIFELATGGDLFSYCDTRRADIHEDEVKFLSWQLVLGIEHIHTHNVAHRDIKLENILLYTRGPFPRLLIGDFGASLTLKSLVDSVPSSSLGGTTREIGREGTILYLPPERLKAFGRRVHLRGLGESLHGSARKAAIGKRWFDEEVQLDIWALGVVMFQMVAGDHPYRGEAERLRAYPKARAKRQLVQPQTRAQIQIKQEPDLSFPEVVTPQESTPVAGPSNPNPKPQPKPKRKFADLDNDDDDDDEDNEGEGEHGKGGKGDDSDAESEIQPMDWDSFRREYGHGKTGAGGQREVLQVEQLIADIGFFKDRSMYDWLPFRKWGDVAPTCKLAIASLLQYRPERRLTIPALRTHEWFTSNQAELDELYEAIVTRSAPQ